MFARALERDLFEVFREFGGYIAGYNAVISKWAEFSVKANREIGVDYEKALGILNEYPITERDTGEASKFYSNLMRDRGYLECVWSGKKIRDPSTLHIDHVIPFSAWKNNDLWNLMPSHANENIRKKDRIPSQALLQRRKTILLSYWRALIEKYPQQFGSEINISLTGRSYDDSMLIDEAYKKLLEKTRFLVENRGYPEWDP
jgi:CRISPR/Cas system Type II protein with McrA/HNH and RuvC-like nuclease domain